MTRAGLRPDDGMQAAIGMVGDCPDAAFLVDRDGTIIAWNTAASELFGRPAWEASAHTCAAIVKGCSPAGSPLCRAGCPLLTDKGPAPRSAVMRIRNGGLGPGRSVQVHHLPIRDPRLGTTIAMLHVIDSLT
jgi:hypothetical protein